MSAPPPAAEIGTGEAAALLGTSARNIRKLAEAGAVSHRRTRGGHRRFDRAEILALRADLETGEGPGAFARAAEWRQSLDGLLRMAARQLGSLGTPFLRAADGLLFDLQGVRPWGLAEAQLEYSEEEWPAIRATMLDEISTRQLQRILMRWWWADRAKGAWFAAYGLESLQGPPTENPLWLESESYFYMHMWFALLWAVIESLTEEASPAVVLEGRLGEDVSVLRPTLKRARNATFHVPRQGRAYPDQRLVDLVMKAEDNPFPRIWRAHSGLLRLLTETLDGRPDLRSRLQQVAEESGA